MPRSVAQLSLLGLSLLLILGCNRHERLRMKAQMGNRRAMYELGVDIWQHTSGRKDEVDEAIAWITKAAEKGEMEAIYEIGTIYEAGGGPRPKAVYWFRKGAEAGDPNCMVKLAKAHRYGDLGLSKDESQYRHWMDKAMAVDRERRKEWGK